jgi:hypothetical protein
MMSLKMDFVPTFHEIPPKHTQEKMPEAAIRIRLLTGERIRSRGIHITHVYADLICGVPTKESNQQQLSELPDEVCKIFGEFPVHVLPPTFKKLR